jgi:uncharacterized phage protein gp47/JayE
MTDEYGVTEDGFNRKGYEDIRDDMLDKARDVFGSDWNLGVTSVTGMLVRAVAFGMELLWMAAERVYQTGYVRTAYGQSLDYAVDRLGLDRQSAVKAEGIVTFEGTAGDTVPAGTEVTNTDDAESPVFETREDADIQARGEVDAFVDAVQAGAQGNVGAGNIDGLVNAVSGVQGVDNEPRSHTLTIGSDLNSTTLQTVKIGEVVYQTVDVSDILHDIFITQIDLEVTTPTNSSSFYQLRVRILDDATGSVLVDPKDISTTVDPAGTETVSIDQVELDVRDADKIRIEIKVESQSDSDLRIQKDTTNNYANGELVVDGTTQSGDDWVAAVVSETLGNTRNGENIEKDQELRSRYFNSLFEPGSSTLPSVEAAVLNEQDVRDVNIAENTTNSVDAQGRPAHSFEITVRGGDDVDIADAILNEKPAGIQSHGGVTQQVTDDLGVQRDISFSRPTEVTIDVIVDITSTDEFAESGIRQVKDQIITYIGGVLSDNTEEVGLLLGEDVIHSEVLAQVMVPAGVLDASVTLRRGNDTFDSDNVTISSGELAETTVGSITVSVQ